MNVKITKAHVEKVKHYKEKYPDMSQFDIGLLTDLSAASVGNILNGKYEHLLNTEEEDACKTIESSIPYEEYKRLVTCEIAIKEMFNQSKDSTKESGLLFIDYHAFSFIMNNYFPEQFENRLAELREGEEVCCYDYED